MKDAINPESAVLQQLEGHWRQVAALVLWKCVGRAAVVITAADMQRLEAEFSPGMPVLLTHGHADSLEFRIVDEATAQRLAEYDRNLKGTA